MKLHMTLSIKSTSTSTWICTLFIDARFVTRAFGINHAFRSAVRGTTNISGCTRTHRPIIDHTTKRVGTTRWWYAGIVWDRRWFDCFKADAILMMDTNKSRLLLNLNWKQRKLILPSRKHWTNGSPVNSGLQLQIGLWLTTRHSALKPQVPAHGSIHFWLTHDLSRAQSEEATHSGRQYGGCPIESGRHVHTGRSLRTRQLLYWPQGEGWQGFDGRCTLGGGSCWIGWHRIMAFPKEPVGQVQTGWWRSTWHSAVGEQAPAQGLTHCVFRHDLSDGQSEFWMHSGRHPV